jgi:HSP20 family protein
MSDREEKKKELSVRKPSDALDPWNDMFEDFWGNWMIPYPKGMRRVLRDLVSQSKTDLIDNEDSYELHLDVPGIPKEKLSISVTESGVEVSGKAEVSKEEEKKNYLFKERSYSEVYRKLNLSEGIIPEKTEATVKDGVLTVKMPKKQLKPTMKAHKVEVK